jgi:hypothetical protein
VTALNGVGLARLAPTEIDDERRTPRYRLLLAATAGVPVERHVNVLIHDISADGIRIESRTPIAIGSEIAIELPSVGEVLAEVVRADGPIVGAAFRNPLDRAKLKAVLNAASVVWLPDDSSRADRRCETAPQAALEAPRAWRATLVVILIALFVASLAWLQAVPSLLRG